MDTCEVLPEAFWAEYDAARTDHARWRAIGHYFHTHKVAANRDLRPATFYFVHAAESHVILSGGDEPGVDPLPMTVVRTGQAMKPVPRRVLLEMGRKSQLFRLAPRVARPLAPPATVPPTDAGLEPDDQSDAADVKNKDYIESMIEPGSFTQLMVAAQASGIVPAADQIGHVRDCEFRYGHHQIAFEAIERLYVGLRQAADTRQQRLRTEEIDYRSGVLKMSPKEWQQKKQRDTAQTNRIERARRHFVRVLDGLRVLILSK
jgi:hypothetical protein